MESEVKTDQIIQELNKKIKNGGVEEEKLKIQLQEKNDLLKELNARYERKDEECKSLSQNFMMLKEEADKYIEINNKLERDIEGMNNMKLAMENAQREYNDALIKISRFEKA